MKPFINATVVFLATLLVFFSTNVLCEPNAPAVDIYVKVLDTETFGPSAAVEVLLKDHTIECTTDQCPAEDIRVPGEAFDRKGNFLGIRMVTIKKGYLNNEKHWSYDHPKHRPIRGNNLWIWEI